MPTYCSLSDAYGPSWGIQSQIQNQAQKVIDKADDKKLAQFQGQQNHQGPPNPHDQDQQVIARFKQADKAPQGGEIKSGGCPNCDSCLKQNNGFQQQVINQAIYPRPRWIPQNNGIPFDPYVRQFENFNNYNTPRIENFVNMTTTNANNLIQLVLYLLIALFIIQLFELILNLN